MQKLMVPVLLLAIVALSSSHSLPIVSMNDLNAEPLEYRYQENDNTFNSKQQNRNKLDAILFNFDVEPETNNIPAKYIDNKENVNSLSKDDIYNVKGFRKEQWHNYPRQLDRLNRYFFQHQSADKRNLDPDDPRSVFGDEPDRYEEIDDTIPNEYVPENEPESRSTNNEAEMAAAVINPLLIFRIHLACYNSNKEANQVFHLRTIDNERLQDSNKDESSFLNEINPGSKQIKVKREDKTKSDVDTAHEPSENPTVNKRIFALFSRLQSLNPKGHQLHHRRHMYAMYGPPDADSGGGGVLTAETRATFMRPPGSPLRWG